MRRAFVTYLGNKAFIPGVQALYNSLRLYNKSADFIILVKDSIEKEAILELERTNLQFKLIQSISNPYDHGKDERGVKSTYDKLWTFALDEYDKLVFLDADLIICENIESLFEKPHMSAVVAGKLLPENMNWADLNSGVMVVNPDKALFSKFQSLFGKVFSADGTDQGFLNSYYSDWNSKNELHLHHRYNIPAIYLDKYCQLYDFKFSFMDNQLITQNVSILHFWGPMKPWHYSQRIVRGLGESKFEQSVKLWWECFSNS
jgi:lipopolysaccharide biosynthesis glycosyltransferase